MVSRRRRKRERLRAQPDGDRRNRPPFFAEQPANGDCLRPSEWQLLFKAIAEDWTLSIDDRRLLIEFLVRQAGDDSADAPSRIAAARALAAMDAANAAKGAN